MSAIALTHLHAAPEGLHDHIVPKSVNIINQFLKAAVAIIKDPGFRKSVQAINDRNFRNIPNEELAKKQFASKGPQHAIDNAKPHSLMTDGDDIPSQPT